MLMGSILSFVVAESPSQYYPRLFFRIPGSGSAVVGVKDALQTADDFLNGATFS